MKFGAVVYICGSYFTLVAKSSILEKTKEKYPTGYILMIFYIISFVIIFVSILIFLFEYFFMKTYSNFTKLDDEDDFNHSMNFSEDQQRLDFISHAQSYQDQDY